MRVSFVLDFTLANLLFIAGDLSGDYHMALLARRVLSAHPNWRITALGGPHLAESGAQMLGDSTCSSVIGFLPSLLAIPRGLFLQRRVLDLLKTQRFEAAVLCDWGAFNSRLLMPLQRRGVPVLYYFPPRSWQREGTRGLSIAPLVQRVATPFEWSAKRLREAGCDAHWVGHPLLESTPSFGANGEYSEGFRARRQALRDEFGATENEQLIALLPGSRNLELKLLAPPLSAAARLLSQKLSTRRFVVAAAKGRAEKTRAYFAGDVRVEENRTDEIFMACDAAIVKSGTSTLQAAVMGAPQVVVYDVPPLLRAQAKRMGVGTARVPFVAMPNILLQREIVRELLGEQCTPQNIADEVERLLQPEKAATMRREYSEVREALGALLPMSATERTAQMLEEMLQLQKVSA